MNRMYIIILLLFFGPLSYGQTVTWDNGGNQDDWHDPLNWDGDVLPTISDEVIILSSDVVTIFNGDASVRKIVNSGTFTIGPGRTLTLDEPNEIALENKSSTGDLINQGTIHVLNAGTHGIYINTGAAMDSEPGAEIICENITSGTAILLNHNNSTLTNEGIITVTNNIYRGINADDQTQFKNKGGTITVYSSEYAVRASGVFTNEGLLEVTSTSSFGIWSLSVGSFSNSIAGTLRVLSSGNYQINIGGNSDLDNYGVIELLGNVSNFSFGLYTNGTVINRASGSILINDCTWDGIYITANSAFDNFGSITISDNIDRNGIYNIGALTNHPMGEINISDTGDAGIYNTNSTGIITNDGTINLIANIGAEGIGAGIAGNQFVNNTSGNLSINNTISEAISCPFVNYGTLELKSGIGGIGIARFGQPVNQACGTIISEMNIYSSLFINLGTIKSSYSSANITANTNFINNGVIEDLNGPMTISNFNNNGYRLTNIPDDINEGDATLIMQEGLISKYSGIDFSWFTDAARTISAGVHVPITNEWVPNNNSVGLDHFFLNIEYPQGCAIEIEATLDNVINADPGLEFETIVNSGYWNDPSTWDQNKIPRAIDDVYSAADLIIPAGYSAKAKSLTIENDLTIEPTGDITIYDSNEEGFINEAEVDLYGKMVVYQSVNESVANNALLNIHPCGELYMYGGMIIGSLNNEGYIFQDYTGPNSDLNYFINDGALEDLQGSFDGISLTNNELIISPIDVPLVQGEPLPNVLDISNNSSIITISENWYLDASLSTIAGSYNQFENSWVPNENAIGNSIFYFEITTVNENCPIVMKISFDSPVAECTTGSITLNAGETDYYSISSWDMGRLPNACDNLTIPLETDSLSLPSSHSLVYQSIVNYGALEIPLGSKVAIDYSIGAAIDNQGDITNNGEILITNPGTRGIYSHSLGSSFTNRHLINITGADTDGIYSSSYLLNDTLGNINITSADDNGIINFGQIDSHGDIIINACDRSFLNYDTIYSSGNINCINTDSYAFWNTSGAFFENQGTMSMSGSSTIIALWNVNASKYLNGVDGVLNIEGTSTSIDNFGLGSEFENFGIINITNTSSVFKNRNEALFTNAQSGTINISGVVTGIHNFMLGVFNNSGQIDIHDITSSGIGNSATFNHKVGGSITINDCNFGIHNSKDFTSEALINIGPLINIRHILNTNTGDFIFKDGSQLIIDE